MKSTCYTWSLCCKRSGWHGIAAAAAYGSGRFCAATAATSAMIKAWTSLVVNTFVSTDVGGEDKSQVKTPTRKPEQEQLAHMGTRHRAAAARWRAAAVTAYWTLHCTCVALLTAAHSSAVVAHHTTSMPYPRKLEFFIINFQRFQYCD